MMSKKTVRNIAFSLSVMLVAGLLGGFIWVNAQEKDDEVNANAHGGSEVSDHVKEQVEEIEDVKENGIEGKGKDQEDEKKYSKNGVELATPNNPFDNISFGKNGMNDDDVQHLIHQMSHQKVKADEKRGLIPITDERIDWLLEKIEFQGLEHEDTYREILEEWKAGDFSNAVEHHNTIWELQGGTTGKAYDLLSETEEQAYLGANVIVESETEKSETVDSRVEEPFSSVDNFILYIDDTAYKILDNPEYDSVDEFIEQAEKDVERGIDADYETQKEIGNHIARYGIHFFSSTGDQIRVYLKGLVRESMPFHEDAPHLSDEERKREFQELYELVNKYD